MCVCVKCFLCVFFMVSIDKLLCESQLKQQARKAHSFTCTVACRPFFAAAVFCCYLFCGVLILLPPFPSPCILSICCCICWHLSSAACLLHGSLLIAMKAHNCDSLPIVKAGSSGLLPKAAVVLFGTYVYSTVLCCDGILQLF